MKSKIYTPIENLVGGLRTRTIPFVLAIAASSASLMLSPSSAAAITPDAAASECRQWFNSVRNVQELSNNQRVLIAVKRCIDLGIDPPLKLRKDYGRSPASGVATAQIPGTTCPPFATCLYSARVNTRAGQQSLNYGVGGTDSAINDMVVNSVYSAPQFVGHLPATVPQHLTNGGTVYFYGDVKMTPPNSSLLYPDSGVNYFADGGAENITNGHVMTPPPPNGEIMAQRPVIVNQNAKVNFDDGGIIMLPAGFSGVINGRAVSGGDLVIINHAEDFFVPAGTSLYPFPMGSHPAGEHASDHNHQPYNGPPIKLPQNVEVQVQSGNQPGDTVWW